MYEDNIFAKLCQALRPRQDRPGSSLNAVKPTTITPSGMPFSEGGAWLTLNHNHHQVQHPGGVVAGSTSCRRCSSIRGVASILCSSWRSGSGRPNGTRGSTDVHVACTGALYSNAAFRIQQYKNKTARLSCSSTTSIPNII